MTHVNNLIDAHALSLVPKHELEPEMVLAIDRNALTAQSVGTDGMYPISWNTLDSHTYAFLPRHLADNKKDRIADALDLAKLFPQILGYFQIQDHKGRFLVYNRKGKEEGLLGKHSIGVGGHVDLSDAFWLWSGQSYVDGIAVNATGIHRRAHLHDLISTGAIRELREEINYVLSGNVEFDYVISSYADDTSKMHVGLPKTLYVTVREEADNALLSGGNENTLESLTFDPAEYLNVRWMTKEELQAALLSDEFDFETWSRIVIENM